jgi:predicted DNA-binding transcriptional regulator AlpA
MYEQASKETLTVDSQNIPLSPLLTTPQAAHFLGLKPNTLEKFRIVGGGPIFFKLTPRCVRYRTSDLLEWVESKARTSTSDNGGEAK